MTPRLQLDLNAISIDASLAQRVPYALSRYYLALPLGEENGSVSVAMAYPENVNAHHVLGHLLQARVVPVFTPAELLLPVLEHIYHPCNEERHAILAWYDQARCDPVGSDQVGQETAVSSAVSMLSDALHVSATTYCTPEHSLEDVLHLAAGGQCELIVMPPPTHTRLSTILNQAAAPLFLVRGEQPSLRNILVVMRGFASDERVIDWLTALTWQQHVTVTLMPLFGKPGAHLHPYQSLDSPAAQHLDRCVQRSQADGITVTLKYRFGDAINQVVEEVAGSSYDLLILAAEAEGDFVSRVITAIDQHHAHHNRPIFILKPPELLHELAL
jgi:hypothetical protein